MANVRRETARREYTIEPSRKKENTYDYTLLFLTLVLICFGFVMIYSSSSYVAQIKEGDAAYYVKRQMIAAALGLFVMIFVSVVCDYQVLLVKRRVIRNLCVLSFLIAIFLQIIVLIPGIGMELNGARRWLKLPVLGTFQPSDFAKLALIIFLAYLIQYNPKDMNKGYGFLRVYIFVAPLLALIAKENMSTAIILGIITVGITFITCEKKWYFLILGIIAGVAIAAFLIFGDGFRMERIEIWRDLENHEKGYQILQGLYAIASGGLWGSGLGESMQKLGFIPEAQNDMIFSIICEELGLVGAIAVLLLFTILLWRIFVIGMQSADLFGGLICMGVFIHIAAQVILNIAVVTNTIPSTGVALPFISYGGTSVLLLMVEIGLVLNVSRQAKRVY